MDTTAAPAPGGAEYEAKGGHYLLRTFGVAPGTTRDRRTTLVKRKSRG